ncbi:hypothetical protein ES703_78637 [subsurface metagenome]
MPKGYQLKLNFLTLMALESMRVVTISENYQQDSLPTSIFFIMKLNALRLLRYGQNGWIIRKRVSRVIKVFSEECARNSTLNSYIGHIKIS